MSTNYYFKVKDIDKLISQIQAISPLISCDILTMIKDSLSCIHIGKRSNGWMPLFEAHAYFTDVQTLERFYSGNKDQLIIVDEYDRELAWEELDTELINWMPFKGKSQCIDSNNEYYIDSEGYEWAKFKFC